MTEAEKAFAFAEKRIEEARASGSNRLNFDREEMRALERLPASINSLTSVTILDCNKTQISDLSPLSGLENLRGLWLENTGVTDLAPLTGLETLTALELNNTSVSDLGPLSGLKNLTYLRLHDTSVSDLGPLSDLENLKVLGLDNTSVSDLGPLSGLQNLTDLWLDETEVQDLRPLRRLRRLAEEAGGSGLTFEGCAAARSDPEIARIAGIGDPKDRARTLFAYLEDWEPPEASPLPKQSPDGFEHGVQDGKVSFRSHQGEQDAQAQDLYQLLREDLDALLETCPSGHNAPYASFRKLLERYDRALGTDLNTLLPPRFWNEGNKLRLELKADTGRSDLVLDGPQKLNEELQTGLDALVALHNVFVSTYAPLSALDANRPDPIDRPTADAARDQMGALIDAITPQVRLILEDVIEEYHALHATSGGDGPFAARALAVEGKSLENLILVAVREAMREEKEPGALKVTLSDARAASVGAAVTGGATYVAPTFAHLVTVLEPQMGALLAAAHAQDYPIRQTLAWVVNKVRNRGQRFVEQETEAARDKPTE